MQNIGADNAGDAFYRYKMPKLVAKIEGRGNGIKTNIVNNVDIARALDRPPTYTLKHFGCELGAQTNFNASTGVSIVNGAHDAKKLSEVLEIFIKKYVQCYGCGNPETIVKVRKETIFLKCKACGHTSDVDMRDKLTTFIVKNPPMNKLSKSEAKVKKDEKERMKAAEKEAKRAEKAEAKEKKKKEKSKASMSEKSKDEDGAAASNSDNPDRVEDAEAEGDNTVFKTDLSADAVARRQQEQLSSAAAALVQGEVTSALSNMQSETSSAIVVPDPVPEEDQAEKEEDLQPVDLVRQFIEGNKPALELVDLLAELEVHGGLVGKMKIFYSALLGGKTCSILECMAAPRDKYILALKQDGKHQASSLIALEHYLTQIEPERMGEMPFVLKMLFEEDLIEDEIIVGWGSASSISLKNGVDKNSAVKVRALCEKVLAWLEESDDEESDDEE